jgi:hypothetical protein
MDIDVTVSWRLGSIISVVFSVCPCIRTKVYVSFVPTTACCQLSRVFALMPTSRALPNVAMPNVLYGRSEAAKKNTKSALEMILIISSKSEQKHHQYAVPSQRI